MKLQIVIWTIQINLMINENCFCFGMHSIRSSALGSSWIHRLLQIATNPFESLYFIFWEIPIFQRERERNALQRKIHVLEYGCENLSFPLQQNYEWKDECRTLNSTYYLDSIFQTKIQKIINFSSNFPKYLITSFEIEKWWNRKMYKCTINSWKLVCRKNGVGVVFWNFKSFLVQ